MKLWKFLENDADVSLMSSVLDIHEITANCLANRGIKTKKAAINFLNPSILGFADFFDMKHAKKSVELILCAIKQKKNIIIYGDYDVDGIMSTTILYKTLKSLNANVDFYIPHRIDEGYGLNINAIEILANTADMIITVDNGISAMPEIEHAINLGLEVIIIDHHEPGEIVPVAHAVIDPKQADCNYRDKNYCAAGLSFRLCEKLLVSNRKLLNELIVFAAIATICDIVPLLGENRIIVKHGLDIINKHKLINPGLGTLITARGYLDKPIDVQTIGFIIGPCLNAAGRLEYASKAVELLISDSQKQQSELTQIFINLNDERKKLTEECVNNALKLLDNSNVVVIVDNTAHESVAGIAAGRVRDKINRPVIIITNGTESMKGSGRSIDNYNMYEELYAQKHLLERFGGHAMAAGLSILPENIENLRLLLNKSCRLNEKDFAQIFYIERELKPKDINLELALELEKLAPFGKSNKEPLFVSYGLLVESIRNIPDKNTMIFNFKNLKGIAFGLNEMYTDNLIGSKIDVVYLIEKNIYNGNTTVQIRIKDFVEATSVRP